MTQLKPVTDKEREFLRLMGETPEQHQKQVLNPKGKLSSTKTIVDNLMDFKTRSTMGIESTNSIASRLEEKEKENSLKVENIKWIPECYVFFLECTKCAKCNSTRYNELQLFLKHKRLRETMDLTQMKHYVPVSSISINSLPRILDVKNREVGCCLACFNPTNLVEVKRNNHE
jgi:hypothetical protein